MFNRVEAIETILERSPYFESLCKYVASIGFMFQKGCELVILAGKNDAPLANILGLSSSNVGIVDIESLNSFEEVTPELCVKVNEEEITKLAEQAIPLSKLSISTSEGQVLPPQVENIIKRILMPPTDAGFPLADRIELIYGSLFGFIEPKLVWRSEQSDLLVLKYEAAFEGLDVYITSGFTNPELSGSQLELENGSTSGYGYELLVMAESTDTTLIRELISWTKFVEETKIHIFQGQYLEYQEGKIPGTDLGGFIVVPPIDLPEIIPVVSGYGMLNLLIGVTLKELEIAKKEDDIYIVADKLFEAGYVNYSPLNRDSVL
ncbi:suppressor of fused domain protein [Paenibacillus massiliensis]|uniref:suppressor of fused domain protein n=1 Tax=Paenibacillus massiliensis TaxID=225917 RepID=UPI00046F0A2B|nr:suppressor of fused domain protein [Paenibacillus massiliensis]